MTQPNVIVLYADQMQHNLMGFTHDHVRTPNLDKLAAEGVHFTHAFTNHAQCSPSRSAVITGQPAHQCGVMAIKGFHNHQNQLTGEEPLLAKEFNAAGYRTVHFGKSHLSLSVEELGYEEGYHTDNMKVTDEEAEKRGISYVAKALQDQYVAFQDALGWVKDQDKQDRPLFFTFSTNLPHPPFFDEVNYLDNYDPDTLDVPASFHDQDLADMPDYRQKHQAGNHGAHDETKLRKTMQQYYSMTEAMDDQYGQLMDALKDIIDWDNTIVLFHADHGDMMGAHKLTLKGTLPYDELYRIPCLLKLPSSITPKRTTIDDLVCNTHFASSLMTLAGVDVPDTFEAPVLAEAIQRDSHPEDERIFFEHYAAYWGTNPFYGIRTRDTKYVWYYGDEKQEEMFDLAKDPLELKSVATNPHYANCKASLKADLDKWWQTTDGRDFAFYDGPFKEHGKAALRQALQN